MDASLNTQEPSEQRFTPSRRDTGPSQSQGNGPPRAWLAILGLVILAAMAAGCRTYRFADRRIREERPEHGSWINAFISSWKIEDTPYPSAYTHHPKP